MSDLLGLFSVFVMALFCIILIVKPKKVPLLNIVFGLFTPIMALYYEVGSLNPFALLIITFIGIYTIVRAIQGMISKKVS